MWNSHSRHKVLDYALAAPQTCHLPATFSCATMRSFLPSACGTLPVSVMATTEKKMYYIKDRESRCWGPASSPSRTWVPVIFPCIFYCCCHIAVSLGKSLTCIKALGICEKCSVFDPHLGFKCCNLCIAKQIKKFCFLPILCLLL